MKRLFLALATGFAALAATAGSALAAGPVQSTTQSSSTGQAALAASSATQVAPSNENISVRVLSPGNDGSVSQSNTASSTANASNNASTTQSATQAASGCGCAIASGKLGDVLGTAMQAAQAAPAPSTGQSNNAGSTGTAANAAPTTQSTSQSGGGGGVQSSTQDAGTDQTAVAASDATQVHPSNSNISVRVLSPGDDGSVSQSNNATSTADASNSATTNQSGTQSGGGSGGVQSSTQGAGTSQGALALSAAKQIDPENKNLSVRVLSEGNNGSVSQSNNADSTASATNSAPVSQTAMQSQAPSCGCMSHGPAVQAVGQYSSVEQAAAAASDATQIHPSNVNDPVRVWSDGNDGRVEQSNNATSEADATNTAPVTQSAEQNQAPSECGCSHDPAVQALGQQSSIGQLAIGLSAAKQIGATNENGPIRVYSDGMGGSVSQDNTADSSADATNNAAVNQSGEQNQSGSGIQALAQDSSIEQIAFAASAALQLPGRSECGCGSSFGNSNDPVRIWSDGNDGYVSQENTATSSADASNDAAVTQSGMQMQSSHCGCGGLGVQALGQYSSVGQLAAALSSALQIGASNSSAPVRVWSTGGGGSTRQSNGADSTSTAPNVARILQRGLQVA